MAGGGLPKRGGVTKGILNDVFNVVKEVTELSAEQLNVNVRVFKERQANLRASIYARRREKLRRMPIAKKQGRGRPKRGDVKKRIGKELVQTPVKKLIKIVKNHNESEVSEMSEMSVHPGLANLRLPGVALSNTARNGGFDELVEDPMQGSYLVEAPMNHGSAALPNKSSATSSLASDSFLRASPFPTKIEVMAKHWYKVDMSRALVHKGSVLYEEQKGKWAVMGSCSDEAGGAVIPLITSSLRVATPL